MSGSPFGPKPPISGLWIGSRFGHIHLAIGGCRRRGCDRPLEPLWATHSPKAAATVRNRFTPVGGGDTPLRIFARSAHATSAPVGVQTPYEMQASPRGEDEHSGAFEARTGPGVARVVSFDVGLPSPQQSGTDGPSEGGGSRPVPFCLRLV